MNIKLPVLLTILVAFAGSAVASEPVPQPISIELQTRERVTENRNIRWMVSDEWSDRQKSTEELNELRARLVDHWTQIASKNHFKSDKDKQEFIDTFVNNTVNDAATNHDSFRGNDWSFVRDKAHALIVGRTAYNMSFDKMEDIAYFTPSEFVRSRRSIAKSDHSQIEIDTVADPLHTRNSVATDLTLTTADYSILWGVNPLTIYAGSWHVITSSPQYVVIAPDIIPDAPGNYKQFEVTLDAKQHFIPVKVVGSNQYSSLLITASKFATIGGMLMPQRVERKLAIADFHRSDNWDLQSIKPIKTITIPLMPKHLVIDRRISLPDSGGVAQYISYPWTGILLTPDQAKDIFYKQHPELKPVNTSRNVSMMLATAMLLLFIGTRLAMSKPKESTA